MQTIKTASGERLFTYEAGKYIILTPVIHQYSYQFNRTPDWPRRYLDAGSPGISTLLERRSACINFI